MATTNFSAFPMLKDTYSDEDESNNKSIKSAISAIGEFRKSRPDMFTIEDDKHKYFQNVKRFMQQYNNKGPYEGVK